ncbi:unnamed protein product, partial [Ectocarpus sp. 13 AM-2016]
TRQEVCPYSPCRQSLSIWAVDPGDARVIRRGGRGMVRRELVDIIAVSGFGLMRGAPCCGSDRMGRRA